MSKVLEAFECVSEQGDGWVAQCPCSMHGEDGQDDHPSVRITIGEEGRILLTCRVGCKLEDVLNACELEERDLFCPQDQCQAEAFVGEASDECRLLSDEEANARHEILRNVGQPLTDIQQLLDRGLSGEAIWWAGYRQDASGRLLIPVRDIKGRIVALKVRSKNDCDGPRYSYWREGDGAPIHVPRISWIKHTPVSMLDYEALEEEYNVGTVRVTEGELKADVCEWCDEGNIPTLGLPGVAHWRKVFPLLSSLRAHTVIIAFDWVDVRSKYPVFQQWDSFHNELMNRGYRVEIETWNDYPECKGIDDLLAAGKKPSRWTGSATDEVVHTVFEENFKNKAAKQESIVTAVATLPTTAITTGPAEFPLKVFPLQVQNFITKVAASCQCPIDFPGVAALVIAGAAIGTTRCIRVWDSWYECPSVYAAVVAPPGSAKTPAFQKMMGPVYEQQHKALLSWKAAGRPTEAPPEFYSDDFTVEAMMKVLSENPRGLLLSQDEITAWVAGMNQYRDGGKGNDKMAFLSAWSGKTHKVNRRGSRVPFIIERPFVSIFGGITPDMLGDLEDEKGREDGFIHRILFTKPQEMRPQPWPTVFLHEKDMAVWLATLSRLYGLRPNMLGTEWSLPQCLDFDDSGLKKFQEWWEAHRLEMDNPDFPRAFLGPWSKLKNYAARFSLILHMLAVISGSKVVPPGTDGKIDAEDVAGAWALTDYFKAHWQDVHKALRCTQTDKRVDDFISWVQRGSKTREAGQCSVSQMISARLNGIKNKTDAKKLIDEAVGRMLGTWGYVDSKKERFVLIPELKKVSA